MSTSVVDWDPSSIGKGHDFARFALLSGLLREYVGGGSILDIGCDTATLKRLLGEADYTGLDARKDAIDTARSLFPNSRFVCARAEDWMPDRTFDSVVFNESLYYLNDFAGSLAKFCRCLRCGGLLAISIYRHPRWFSPTHKALRESRRFADKTCSWLHD